MSHPDASKIDLGELRDFAAASGTSRRSVIVELCGAGLKVPARPASRAMPPKSEVVPRGTRPDLGRGEAMDQLQQALGALGLARDVVRLDAAEAFVVSVTPAQLRDVAGLPLVGIVRPNRTHRASRKRTGS
ncbi:hypothetical protein [Aquisphaera insulae]|uniref:hypothetical protein n=1 Tax=Aquisphaera insulae TaxID=2712864 RepID=UPI0013ED4BEB|nr:hypothetical protein [Aquisphaera insulae]